MGKIASRCLKGCEGGKKEAGEENLEYLINTPIKAQDDTIDVSSKAIAMQNSKRDDLIDGKKCKKLNNF